MIRRAAVLALVATLLGAWWLGWPRRGTFRLPERLPLETAVADLSAELDPAAVAQAPASGEVRVGALKPGDAFSHDGAGRNALVTPVGTRLRYHVRAPADAVLRFAVGVESAGRRDASLGGIRFTVEIDGARRFARVVNPAATRSDRVWFDDEIDLTGGASARDVEITLATDAAGGGPLAGVPGWSGVRVVGRRFRDRQPADPAHPNVLVLLVDTLRADRLGCYGATPSPSPALDGLARDGAVFARHVAQAPWTLPSVASVLTGVYPTTHGALGDDARGIRDAVPTLAELAAQEGITTLGVSSNPLVSRGTRLSRGFETFVELDFTSAPPPPDDPDAAKDPPTAADVNAVFLSWLRAARAHRFLAYLHYMEPHHPYTPPRRLRPPVPPGVRRRIAAGRLSEWGPQIATSESLQLPAVELDYLRALYDAEIRSWDEELARLLDALAAMDLLRSTVVVVTADHGEEFAEHGRLQHGFHLYEELVHVPLVVHGPGVAAGRVESVSAGIDVLPTVAALLGVPVPHDLPGRPLLGRPLAERPAYTMVQNGWLPDGRAAAIYGVRTAGAKLLVAPDLDWSAFFDLVADPGEHAPQPATSADAAGLATQLATWRTANPVQRSTVADPGFRDRLRALGYAD